MAINKVSDRYVLFSLLGMVHLLPFVNPECHSPLGMENGEIKDSQITVSSKLRNSFTGGQARLQQNIKPWGAWCPNTTEAGSRTATMFDKYIQIYLLNLTTVTKVATQGREHGGGREYVKEYKISYSRDNHTWIFCQGKDNAREAKIFPGNKDVSTVVSNDLTPAITARYIRVHPGYTSKTTVCMRLELYGCVSGENQVILSFPVTRSSMEILLNCTPSFGCKGITTERPLQPGPEVRTKNSNTPIIVAVVVSLVALLVILFGILEFRRRHRAPQISTSVNIPEAKVELGPDDCAAEPSRNNQESSTSEVSNLEPVYEEVRLNSPLSAYPKLHGSKQNETKASDAQSYEEVLKQDSEYVIPISGQTESHEEAKLSSLPGYTKLDRSRMDESGTNKDDGYQKLLKVDSDYVIPADSKTEPCKEVGGEKTIPGYKESNTKRELGDNA